MSITQIDTYPTLYLNKNFHVKIEFFTKFGLFEALTRMHFTGVAVTQFAANPCPICNPCQFMWPTKIREWASCIQCRPYMQTDNTQGKSEKYYFQRAGGRRKKKADESLKSTENIVPSSANENYG